MAAGWDLCSRRVKVTDLGRYKVCGYLTVPTTFVFAFHSHQAPASAYWVLFAYFGFNVSSSFADVILVKSSVVDKYRRLNNG